MRYRQHDFDIEPQPPAWAVTVYAPTGQPAYTGYEGRYSRAFDVAEEQIDMLIAGEPPDEQAQP